MIHRLADGFRGGGTAERKVRAQQSVSGHVVCVLISQRVQVVALPAKGGLLSIYVSPRGIVAAAVQASQRQLRDSEKRWAIAAVAYAHNTKYE